MRRAQVVIIVVVALVWGLFMPLAMTVGLCTGMGTFCESLCGTSFAVSTPTAPAATDLISRVSTAPLPVLPDFGHAVLEPPPRPLLLST